MRSRRFSVGEIPHSYIVAHSDLSSDAHQYAFTEDAVQSRFRYTGGGADVGDGRFPRKVEFHGSIGLDVRDARAAPDVATMVPFYGDALGLALLDQVALELGGAGVSAEDESTEGGIEVDRLFQGS